jgi:tripartite-type tricarboxylate transporter receptor subunit TctC
MIVPDCGRRAVSNIERRTFLKSAAGGAVAVLGGGAQVALHPSAARAQAARSSETEWPNRPVRFIVPLAPGGGLDFVARVVGEAVSRTIGQQVVIENRTGAGGTIGIETAIKSPPDGYSVLVTNDNVASAPHILKTGIDYLNELVPVIQLARQPLALAVHPTLAVSSVAELIETAKRQPGLGCATSGAGSNQHVLLEWFGQLAGIKLDHVPYRGAGQAINDLIAGHVRVAFLGPTALIPHYKAGTLRLLAQSAETRSPSLPEVPTLQEAGFKGLVLNTWYAAFVPLGTPAPAIARLNAEMDKALADPATGKSLLQTATEPVGGSAEQLARVARVDSDKYARLARELNIKAN